MCAHIVKRKNKHALNSQHNAPIHACTLNHVLLKPLLVETGFCPCDICSQIQNFKQTCLMMLEEPCFRPLANETFLFEIESNVVKGIISDLMPLIELVTFGILSFSNVCQL